MSTGLKRNFLQGAPARKFVVKIPGRGSVDGTRSFDSVARTASGSRGSPQDDRAREKDNGAAKAAPLQTDLDVFRAFVHWESLVKPPAGSVLG
jgi:hypothetical protein